MEYGTSIAKHDAYDPRSVNYYPVVIVGAGESGIAMGCRLKEVLKFDQFRIFDRQSGLGGTWYINRYPGVACDVPAIFYSFSFAQNPQWTKFYPQGPEIIKYFQGVCEKYQLMDKIQLNTEVKECRWNEIDRVWDVKLQHLVVGTGDLGETDRRKLVEDKGYTAVYLEEEVIRAKIVISAVGILVEPKVFPDSIPGRDVFEGEIFHSARWKHDVDLKDKNVVVVGTGCSAAQFVPLLTKKYGAKKVTQIMRSPPWIVPKMFPPLGTEFWEKYSPWLSGNVPGFANSIRWLIAGVAETEMRFFWDNSWSASERKKYEAQLLKYMKSKAPKKYHEVLTPNYSVGCKRRIFDAEWLASLHDPQIELTTHSLTKLGAKSVTLSAKPQYPPTADSEKDAGEGVEIPADVVVLANGFETTKWLHPLEVVGKGGKSLETVFDERGGPQMYMGTAMDGFPNFFAIFGPNTVTGHSSVIMASENMVEMTLKLIRPILAGDATEVEVKKEKEIAYTQDIQARLKATVWHMGGCHNWYKADNGWDSTAYPYTQIRFAYNCLFPTYSDWNFSYTKAGLRKRRFKQIAQTTGFVSSLLAVFYLRKNHIGLEELKFLAQAYTKIGLTLLGNFVHQLSEKI